MSVSKTESIFYTCKTAGFGLMFALWIGEGETAGFFLLLCLALTALARWRFPELKPTMLLDCVGCIFFMSLWGYARYALLLILFEGMYRNFYWVGFASVLLTAPGGQVTGTFPIFVSGSSGGTIDFNLMLLTVLCILCGLFLSGWEREFFQKLALRDSQAGEYYELKHEQSHLMETLPQIERMTVVAERARIARDIHDNAGHEIVAAYISLQTMRQLFNTEDVETLELYDAALTRLQRGVDKIRETAHNLQTVTTIGAESLLEICEGFPGCPITFRTHGDTSQIPMYVWSMLEACLNESLTNVTRHAKATYVLVELDTTRHLVRLSIENDGGRKSDGRVGIGLQNLRRRAISIGGNFSVDPGPIFRVVCVIPIQEENHETTDR